jgi:hypothetical protein
MPDTKLIVKPTVNFLTTDSDPLLITDVGAILKRMTDNPDYPDPLPPLHIVSAALDAFSLAVTAATNGGKILTATKNARRADLVALVRQLANYVATACDGDYTKLLGSGFPTHKPRREAIGQLTAPTMPVLSHGMLSGTLDAVTTPQRGSFIYNWKIALATAPDTILQTVQTTGTRNTFTGLTPGQLYIVSVNVVGAAGPSDWSGGGRLMVV